MKNLILILLFVPMFAHAQTSHTVAPKETLYSLARQYNIHPKELAAYNNIPVETGLTIGQVIKIPAKGTIPPIRSGQPNAEPVPAINQGEKVAQLAPVYHKVEKKETLYHISKLYPNITVDDIKKWNKLTGDGVSEGTNLIVGYQNGKKGAVVSPVVVKEVEENKTVTKEPRKQTPVNEKAETRENPVVVETKVVAPKTTEVVKEEVNKITGKNFNGGYFKSLYEQTSGKKNMKEESGTAAIFKSTSGWEDGKYYCLHNTAPAGAIVKITNKGTQKSVYAKVLDVIPDLKQNNGIFLRLSNAAADELGAGENNFEAVLNY